MRTNLKTFKLKVQTFLVILKVATFAFCCQPTLLSLPHLGQDWCCCWNYHSTSLILKIAWNNIRNNLQTSVEQIFARFPFSRQQPIGCECWGAGWTQRASWPASSWAGARTRRTRRGTGRWTPTRSLQIPIFPSHVYFCLFYQQMLSQHLRRRPKPSEDEPKLWPPRYTTPCSSLEGRGLPSTSSALLRRRTSWRRTMRPLRRRTRRSWQCWGTRMRTKWLWKWEIEMVWLEGTRQAERRGQTQWCRCHRSPPPWCWGAGMGEGRPSGCWRGAGVPTSNQGKSSLLSQIKAGDLIVHCCTLSQCHLGSETGSSQTSKYQYRDHLVGY